MSAPQAKLATQFARELARIREEAEHTLIVQIRSVLLPIVQNVRQEKNLQKYLQCIDILLKHIEDISSGYATRLQISNALSTSELRIALMVKNGLKNEELAEYLNITPATIKTHRRNIRRKLGITGTKSELIAHLRSLHTHSTNAPGTLVDPQ